MLNRTIPKKLAGGAKVSAANFSPQQRSAACALRLRSAAYCSLSMRRMIAQPDGTPVTALCL